MRRLAVAGLVVVQLGLLWGGYAVVVRMEELLGAERRGMRNESVGLLARSLGAEVAALQAELAAIAVGFGRVEGRLRHAGTPRALAEHLSDGTRLVSLAVVDPRGQGTRAGTDLPELQEDLAAAWREGMGGRPSLGGPVFSEERGEPSVALGQPIFREGKRVVGVVVAVASLRSLVDSLRVAEGGGGTAFLVDSGGRLVAGSSGRPDGPDGFESLEIVEHFRSHGALGRTTMPFTLQREGGPVEVLGSQARVPGVGWGAIVLSDQAAAGAQARRLGQRALLVAAIAAVVAMAMGALVAFAPGRPSGAESEGVPRRSEEETVSRDATGAKRAMVRPGFLKGLLVLAAVPTLLCVAGLALSTYMTLPDRLAIDRAYDRLRPGLPLSDTLSVLAELQEDVFVRVEQRSPEGGAAVHWLGEEDELEAFAAQVRADRPLHVLLAPLGSRHRFTIELDDSRAIRSVSPMQGHAD